jgi:putative transcriptional regulator
MKYKKLYELRTKNKLSMADIAKKIKISTPYYCQLENKQKRLSYEMVLKIATALNTKPDDLFYDEYKN